MLSRPRVPNASTVEAVLEYHGWIMLLVNVNGDLFSLRLYNGRGK